MLEQRPLGCLEHQAALGLSCSLLKLASAIGFGPLAESCARWCCASVSSIAEDILQLHEQAAGQDAEPASSAAAAAAGKPRAVLDAWGALATEKGLPWVVLFGAAVRSGVACSPR